MEASSRAWSLVSSSGVSSMGPVQHRGVCLVVTERVLWLYTAWVRAHSGSMSTTSTTAAVIPILVYEDIEAAHDFLVETFGLASGGLHRLDDGMVVHAEVRSGDAAIWLPG